MVMELEGKGLFKLIFWIEALARLFPDFLVNLILEFHSALVINAMMI